MFTRASLAVLVGAAVAATVAAGAISASSGDDRANHIEGTWALTVNRGPALPPVRAMTTYTRDNSLIGTANATVRGPSHGTWEHVSGRIYADTHIFFRFDPTGTFIGSQKVRETIRLSADGDSYDAIAISDQFDPNGNLTASGLRATITATRVEVERIPDIP
jgi:hypothetical protein